MHLTVHDLLQVVLVENLTCNKKFAGCTYHTNTHNLITDLIIIAKQKNNTDFKKFIILKLSF